MQSTDHSVYSLSLGSRHLTVFVSFLTIKKLIRVDVYNECDEQSTIELSFIAHSHTPARILNRAIDEYFTSGAMPFCYSYGNGEVFSAFASGDACYYSLKDDAAPFIRVPFSIIADFNVKQIETYVTHVSEGKSVPPSNEALKFPLVIRKCLGADVYNVTIAANGGVSMNVSGIRPFNKKCYVNVTYGDTRSSILGKAFQVMSNRQHRESWLLGTPAM